MAIPSYPCHHCLQSRSKCRRSWERRCSSGFSIASSTRTCALLTPEKKWVHKPPPTSPQKGIYRHPHRLKRVYTPTHMPKKGYIPPPISPEKGIYPTHIAKKRYTGENINREGQVIKSGVPVFVTKAPGYSTLFWQSVWGVCPLLTMPFCPLQRCRCNECFVP